MAKKGKKAQKPNKKDGYKMPPPIPPGVVIEARNTKWIIGPSIGVGGFGEIYSAREYKDGESTSNKVLDYPYVVKIEPMENGPLFVEMHFYIRNYDKNDIKKFMDSRKLKQLGMPTFYGSGSFMFQDEELRFLVLERYGTDLWKTFKEVGRRFPAPTVFQLGLQMVDVLDYVHSRSYIHADIKGGNMLLGIKEGTENQAYLLDFGLAYRIVGENYKPDPKSANEGTIEYTSNDRHLGAKTMRGDLEILGYNMLQWLVGELPWEHVLEDLKKVHKMKIDFMSNVRTRIATDYPDVPDELIKFFEYINTLEPKDVPNYTVCRQIFESYLTRVGKTRNSPLQFSTTNNNEKVLTTDDLPSRPNEISNKSTECIEINSDNESQNSKKINKMKKLSLSSPEKPLGIISLIDCPVKLNENQEKNIRNKKLKATKQSSTEIISLLASDSVNEQLHSNQGEKVARNKKNKKKTNANSNDTSLVEVDADSEQCEVNQERQNRKDKKRRNKDPADALPAGIEIENEEIEEQEQKVPKTKKGKKKIQESPDEVPLEMNTEIEQLDDNEVQKNNKKKKINESSKDIIPIESDVQSELQQQEVTKTKKNKKEYPIDIAEAEINAESEQTDENLEKEFKKTKRLKKKGKGAFKDERTGESDAESNLLEDEQIQEVTKVVKNKKRRNENPEHESIIESDQLDVNQEVGIKKTKKKKRNESYQDATENDTEGKDLENNQEQITKTKKSKQKIIASFSETAPDENNAKGELDDNEKHKITRNKKNKKKTEDTSEDVDENEQPDNKEQDVKAKRNKRKSSEPTKDTETESPDEEDQPKKKKKKSSEPNTPQRKSKRKHKPTKYTVDSDSESEFQDKKSKEKKSRRKKKTGIDFEIQFGSTKLPEKTVDVKTSASGRTLRSNGKTTRPNFKNM